MKSNLEIIESQYAEDLVLKAELLLENDNFLLKFSNPTKGLWIANFKTAENKSIETEVLLKTSRKPKFTCECSRYLKDGICEHAVATLLKIRAEKTKKQLSKPKVTRPKTERSDYTFKTILEQVKADDLKHFISYYARKNKDFALAFKVHFASKTETESDDLKFKKLLDEAVKPKTHRHPKMTNREWVNYKNLMDDFIAQVQDCLSLEKYLSGFIITEKCLDKVAYVANNYKTENASVEAYEKKFIKELNKLLKEDLAPELQVLIQKKLVENATYSYYKPQSVNYVDSILDHLTLTEKLAFELNDNFFKKFEADKNQVKNYLLPLILKINSKFDRHQWSLEHINAIHMLKALQMLQSNGDQTTVRSYFPYLDEDVFDSPEKYLIILKDFIIKEDYKKFFKLSVSQDHLKKIEFRIIDTIINEVPKTFVAKNEKYVLKQILKFTPLHQAQILAHFEYFDQLLLLLEKEDNINLLVNFDEILLHEGHTNELMVLYKKFIAEFLLDHIGSPSHSKINTILYHLNKIGAYQIRLALLDFIRSNYSHRKSLIKNIQ